MATTSAEVRSESIEECPVYATLYGPIKFHEVEFVTRNNSIGLPQMGPLTLNPRISFDSQTDLGVSSEGRVYQVVRLPNRPPLAFLLSGHSVIRDILLTDEGRLLALDYTGHILQFRWSLWSKTDTRRIIEKGVLTTGLSTCTVGVGLFLYSLMTSTADLKALFISGAIAGIASIGVNLATGSWAYERSNRETDGFIDTGLRLVDFHPQKSLLYCDRVLQSQAFQSTGILGPMTSGLTLRQALARIGGHVDSSTFGFRTEHLKLARGIPEKDILSR